MSKEPTREELEEAKRRAIELEVQKRKEAKAAIEAKEARAAERARERREQRQRMIEAGKIKGPAQGSRNKNRKGREHMTESAADGLQQAFGVGTVPDGNMVLNERLERVPRETLYPLSREEKEEEIDRMTGNPGSYVGPETRSAAFMTGDWQEKMLRQGFTSIGSKWQGPDHSAMTWFEKKIRR